MAKQTFKKWWTTERRWHKDVLAYFNTNRPEERLRLEQKCFSGVKKMCAAAHKAGRKE